jgi:uroporphyrinogen-III synthase
MHLLVTRPETEAQRLGQDLQQRGHTVSFAPMLTMRPLSPELETAGIDAVVATSQNALRAVAQRPELAALRRSRLFSVGPATGALARELGFKNVIEGPAGINELVDLIAEAPSVSHVLYLAGDVTAADLPGLLATRGIASRKAVVYDMDEVSALPDAVAGAIRNSQLDGIFLMSPRTSRVLVKLLQQSGLVEAAGGLNFYCLSSAVAAPLDALRGAYIMVARLPNSQEILALLDQISSSSERKP